MATRTSGKETVRTRGAYLHVANLFPMAVIAADLVEEAAVPFTCEMTFKELSLVSAVYRNAKIGTVNHM